MKHQNVLAGSMLLLAVALFLNALVLWFKPQQPPALLPSASAQNPASTTLPGIYYLARDTYFLTTNSEGNKVNLWYYDFEAQQEDNKVYLVKSATAN